MSMIATTITHMRAKPRLLKGIFLMIIGVTILYDLIAPRHGEHFVGDRIRMFWAAFALVGSVGMTKIMKGIGHAFLMQPTDFYSRHDDGEDA